MPELKEVFDMVTNQTEPDLDSWGQQDERQRRTARDPGCDDNGGTSVSTSPGSSTAAAAA